MKTISGKLFSNTFYLMADWSLATFIAFLTWIVAGKLLTPQEYGLASVVVNFFTIISFLSLFGLGDACAKLISEYKLSGKKSKIFGLIGFSYKFLILINLIISAFILFSAKDLSLFLFHIYSPSLIYLIILGIVFNSFYLLTNFIALGFQKMKLIFLSNLLGSLTKLVLAILLIMYGFSSLGFIISVIVGFFLATIIRFTNLKVKLNGAFDKKETWKYALPQVFSTIAWLILFNTAPILLNIFTNVKASGIFTFLFYLSTISYFIPSVIAKAALPVLSELYGKGNKKRIKTSINTVFKFTLFLTFPLILLYLIFAEQIILFVGNSGYLEGVQLLRILILTNYLWGIATIFYTSAYATGNQNVQRNILFTGSILFILSSIILIPHFSYIGVGVGYIISSIFMFLSSFLFIKIHHKISFNLSNILKLLVAILISASFMLLFRNVSIILLVPIIVLGILIYFLSLLFFKFFTIDDIERLNNIKETLPKWLQKIISIIMKLLVRFSFKKEI